MEIIWSQNLSTITSCTSLVHYLVIGFLSALTFWIIQYHWKRLRLYRMAAKFDGPKTVPIIGNGMLFMGTNENILKSIFWVCDGFKSPVRAWLGHRLFFAVKTAQDLDTIMNHPDALTKEDLYKYAQPVVGTGLFTAPVAKWKRHRKIIMPAFNQKLLDSFVEVFVETSDIMVQVLRKYIDRKDLDIHDILGRCSLDSICETAMGVKMNTQTTENCFGHMTSSIMSIIYTRMFKVWYHSDFIFNATSMSKTLREHNKYVQEYTKSVVAEKKNEYFKKRQQLKHSPEALVEEVDNLKRKAFLDTLIEMSEEGAKFTDEELREEVNTFMIAGSDTTACATSFICIMLGMHQNIQDECYEEVMNVVGPNERIQYSDLPRLQLLDRVVKESLRLFPIGPVIVRQVTGDIKLQSGKIIPKDSSAVLVIMHVHRNPEYWEEPLKFDPNRFTPEECAKRHPYTYLPFSGGPRNCIGPKYAMMAMKTFVASILRSYRIHTDYKTVEEVRVQQDLVLKPVEGFKVFLSLRE